MASAAEAIDQAAHAKAVDENLWWGSFVILLEQLEGAPVSTYGSPSLVKKLKNNRSWFLDSLTRFKPPNASSREGLNSPEISFGQKRLRIKPELREIALLASVSLSLDEVQSYILVDRTINLGSLLSDYRQPEILRPILIQYYLERQCLLKCVRWIFMHALYIEDESHASGNIREVALSLVQDGLEKKFLTILEDLSQSAFLQKAEVDLITLWVEEILIESNLVLDTFFLAYYENFCGCKGEQWKKLCMLFKGMISGPFHIGEMAESSEAKNSFYHAKVQLVLILIETLNLENLLRMVHDDVPFRSGGIFSLADIQEMDAIISSMIPLETAEAGPLILAWGVFLYLVLSLPDKQDYHPLMATDIMGYVQNATVNGPFVYLVEILQGDFVLNSDGPVSGYLSVLKTFISAFITCFQIADQSESNTLELILEILCKIYRGEESLCKQFWDRDSFIDKPIRSFLYSLEIDFPYNILVVRLLSALCEGPWPAKCVFNFLCNMTYTTSLYEVPGGCRTLSSDMTVVAPHLLYVESFDVLTIPSGVQGHVVRIIDDNTALIRWKCGYSGVIVLLLRLAQEFHSNSYKNISLTLDLLYRMCLYNTRICFALMEISHSSILQSAQLKADMDTTSRIDLVKVICSLAMKLVRGVGSAELVSLCINILGEMLKCSPSYVVELILRANIFGRSYNGPSSGPWFLSGGLAKMVLAECEQNMNVCSLTMAVLDFTRQLVEVGADDEMVSSLVIFALQYVLVNHENWSYKFGYDRWKVTQKVFELVKSCIKALKYSSKLSCLIREILLCDSSVHNMLTRAFCIKSQTLEGLCISRLCDSREIEGLQLSVCSALDAVSSIMMDLLEDTSSDIPVFIQSLLSPAKPVPVVTATASLVSFFHNTAVQVSASRVLSLLCFISSRVQQYSSENTFTVLDDVQLKELSTSMHEIFIDEETKSEDLLFSVVNLLISAAYFQPAFLTSIILSLDMELQSSNMKQQLINDPAVVSSDSSKTRVLNSLMQYLNRSEDLFERSPRLLLGILNLIKALWKGNVQYMQILKKFRSSENFWKKLTLPAIHIKAECGPLGENLDDDEILRLAYRYQCEAAVLDVIAHDIFLHKKVLQDEVATTQGTEPYDGSKTLKSKDVMSKWCVISHLENCAKLFSSSRYPEEIIHRAKMEVVLCVVHMMAKLSSGEPGSLSLSLIQHILSVSQKLSNHPAFLSLLQQYSVRGYSEVNEVNVLVLSDLYHHINGELEGREIAPGHFKEVLQFLLELDAFQNYQCKHDGDSWSSENDNYMFDVVRLRKDLGIELWEHTAWKTSRSHAERMLSLMHRANSVKFLAYSKNSSLRALTSLLSVYMRAIGEPQPTSFHDGISEAYLRTGIEHLSQCVQATKDLLGPAMSPSEESLKFLTTQVELLQSFFKLLSISHGHGSDAVQLLPIYLLLIKTSDAALRLLSDARQSATLHKTVKFFLTLLLTALESIHLIYADKLDSEVDQYAEASLLSLGLLPVLCKYTESSVLCDLSVAAIDLIVKGPLTHNTWLPILQNHLRLQLIIPNLRHKDRLGSVPIIFRFLLTLARLKGGAQMLHSANAFQSVKMLLSFFMKEEPCPPDLEGFGIGNSIDEGEDLRSIWGLGMTITESMISSLGDDASCAELVANAIHYFFSEKASLMYHHLSFPKVSSDDHSKKKARTQKARTSLTTLKETEYALMLTCKLAKHHRLWIREMKEKDSELRERVIHMLAFISKSTQRVGDSPVRTPPLTCPPTLKEETADHERASYVESKQGWFTLAALGSVPQSRSSVISLATGSQAHRTHFSDTVATHMYRIAFLLLKFLCTQARVATKRAEEVGYIDLEFFPELPMPEILHGIQDQSISIVTEICNSKVSREIQPKSQLLCQLLLQILEKALYLELCVSQSCGIRPVMGRTEDFAKEIRLLTQAVDGYPPLKSSIKSLKQIAALVHPSSTSIIL
ncbi:unnamed protein product [Spirodela intermedia]|uniref:Uncharacterized protein n=1 Tax=Spirodela intermedia TaxID=51605 RepID=A0A7I8K4F1_SPIIN|nr:unnamed protein product [Spirodela intermedia]